MAHTSDAILGPVSFKDMGARAGGFICSLALSNDGQWKVCGTDTFGAYVWGPDDDGWRQLCSADVLASSEYDPFPAGNTDANGAYVALAPSDGTHLIFGWRGFFYFSTDGGQSAERSDMAPKRMLVNAGRQRQWNDRIAISPTNKLHALLGTSNDGVYWTKNFGASVTAVSGIPALDTFEGVHSPHLVAFAPNGTTCYIFAQGTGLYRSTTGVDGAFSLVTGGPEFASHMTVDADGALWICEIGYAGFRKCVGTTWSNVTPTGTQIPYTVAVNPSNTQHIIWVSEDGAWQQSLDGGLSRMNGDTWFGNYPGDGYELVGTGDVEWLSGQALFPAKVTFNPGAANEAWVAFGKGVAKSNPPATFTSWYWHTRSRGIRQLVCNSFLSVPGSSVVINFWDQATWKPGSDPTSLTAQPKFPAGKYFDHHWQTDYASDDPDYLVCSAGKDNDGSWFSEDGGETLQRLFPSGLPSGQAGGGGGAVAVNEKAQQIIVPGYNQRAICTDNNWSTWGYLPIDPNIGGQGNWINAGANRRQCVTADKTRPGVFAAAMKADIPDGQGPNRQGLWVTTTGPRGTWTRTFVGRLDPTGDPNDFWGCTLAYIPGKSGELLFTSGFDTLGGWNPKLHLFTNDGLGGRTTLGTAWDIEMVNTFGFGVAMPGQSYPAVFFDGTAEGVSGLYVSFDFFATKPKLMKRFPGGWPDGIRAVGGDMNILGRCYLGFGGSGAIFCDYVDARAQT